MFTKSGKLAVGAAAGSLLLALTGCAGGGQSATGAVSLEEMDPVTLSLSTLAAEPSSAGQAVKAFADRVAEETEGKISFEIYYSSALMTGEESLAGVASGLADAATIVTSYTPQELPVSNWVLDLGSLPSESAPHGLLGGSAATHEMFMTSDALQEEFAENNQKVLAAVTTGAQYDLICTEPVDSMADMAGLRTRVGGGAWVGEVEAVGGVPVPLPAGETYEGLQRGIIDCALLEPASYINFGLWEVAKHYVPVNMSGLPGYALTLNMDTWNELPEEGQKIVSSAAHAYWETHVSLLNSQFADFGREAEQKHGIEVHDSAELNEVLAAHQDKAISELVSNAPASLADPQGFVDDYQGSIDKWTETVTETVGLEEAPREADTILSRYVEAGDTDLAPFFDFAASELFEK
jgi:TRAP-type C4-dicarboxylate transport system substrate-binding protein